ncbi:MAG: 4Fe-4S binding protein, partial [Verrucomicrobia bacterium]|nr:4Fe-4S binding protein [Verrucomicrobiota bacterium]
MQPVYQPPAAQPPWRAWADVGVLSGALGLAAWLALVRRSRRGLFLLAVACLAYFGFWRKGCICPVGSIQNVTLGLADPSYGIPLTVAALFLLPLVFALFFGRVFCASVCPLGAIQEMVIVRPLRLPAWLQGRIMLGEVGIGIYRLFIVVICGLMALGLQWILARTRFGSQLRAAVDDRRVARGLGIPVGKVFAITFAFGSGLAGLGGALGAEI